MKNLPGVSFLVPVFNKAPHLPAVVRQIARQTGSFPRQFVFVDDGSTDGSLELLQNLTARWPNVVIHKQANKGSAGATNACIALADQPYIKFVDADDLLADAATETLLRTLDRSNACLAYGNVQRYATEADIDLAERVSSPAEVILSDALRLSMKNSLFNPTQCLVRAEALREAGGCDERVIHSQEYSMTLRLARRCLILYVDVPVAFIPDQAERLSNNEGRQLQRVTRALALFLRDYPDTDAALRRFACRRAAGRAWHYARRHGGAGVSSAWFRRYVVSLFTSGVNAADFVDSCCGAFDLPIDEC